MSQIICQNLAIGYDGKAILKDINFSINEGDYLCIIGENGSGKSTLMRTLLHLQQPVSGTILLGDGLQSNEIGYLPQQTAVQKDFPASVREIILSGCQNRCGLRPFYNRAEKRQAAEMMEKLQICQTDAIVNYQVDNSRECFLQELCVQRRKYCCWMNRYPGLILR